GLGIFPSSAFVFLRPEMTLNGPDNRLNDDASASDKCGDDENHSKIWAGLGGAVARIRRLCPAKRRADRSARALRQSAGRAACTAGCGRRAVASRAYNSIIQRCA